MTSDIIRLQFAAGHSRLCLRELTGRDQRAVAGTTTADALALVDRLVVDQPEAPLRAEDLVASDRDRILAAIYLRCFGDRIATTLACEKCGDPFDIDFSLRALLASVGRSHRSAARSIGQNRFESNRGQRFRLPTGREERQVGELPPADAEAALLRYCAVDDSSPTDPLELQELLEETAPLIDLELAASCPECGQRHRLHFDIQTYLMNALLAERTRLAAEVHRLAVAYGWSLREILSLTREERQLFVELIDNDSARTYRSP